MISFGMHRREQLSRNQSAIHRLLHGRRVSYRLLRTSTPATAEEIEVFDHIIYYLKLASGVYTTTVQGRFQDLDIWITQNVEAIFPSDRSFLVEDWASSGGATSVEWFQVLRARFPQVRMIASDLSVYLVEASVENDGVYILDDSGRPLQYIAPPFVIRFPERPPFLINQWIAARARRKLEQLAARAQVDLANLRFEHPEHEIRHPPFVFRRLPLTHPRTRALAAIDPAFQLAQQSVFALSHRGPDVIRTMNILNKDYFSDARLSDAVRAIGDSLKPGGVWIVGRTISESPRIHHASMLRKTGDGFEVLARYCEKSEVEDIALTFQRGVASPIGMR
jgi:hypothetical protein